MIALTLWTLPLIYCIEPFEQNWKLNLGNGLYISSTLYAFDINLGLLAICSRMILCSLNLHFLFSWFRSVWQLSEKPLILVLRKKDKNWTIYWTGQSSLTSQTVSLMVNIKILQDSFLLFFMMKTKLYYLSITAAGKTFWG